MERLKNPKFVAALVLAALALIAFLQNSQPVTLKVLFLADIATQISTALLAAFLTGVVTGALAFSHWRSKREKSKAEG